MASLDVRTSEARLTPQRSELDAHLGSHISFLLQNSPIYAHLFQQVTLVSSDPGHIRLHLPLAQIHVNSKKSLHGSVSATLIDFAGGLVIASHDMRDNTGVSVDMNISFVGGAKEGDLLEITARADKVGGSLAFTSVEICKIVKGSAGEKKELVTLGRHTKFVRQRSFNVTSDGGRNAT